MKNKKIVVYFILALVFLIDPFSALASDNATATLLDNETENARIDMTGVSGFFSSFISGSETYSNSQTSPHTYNQNQDGNCYKTYIVDAIDTCDVLTMGECEAIAYARINWCQSGPMDYQMVLTSVTDLNVYEGGDEETPAVSGIVIFPSDKDFTAGISEAISSSTESLWPLLICIIGTLIAFEVLISIRDLIMRKGEKERAGREVKEKKGKFSWSEINKERPKILK